MADYLKLFHDKRLTPSEPHHLEYIKGRLAHLKIEDPISYENYSQHYGINLDVKVTKEPKSDVTIKNNQVVKKKVVAKKKGRPAKKS